MSSRAQAVPPKLFHYSVVALTVGVPVVSGDSSTKAKISAYLSNPRTTLSDRLKGDKVHNAMLVTALQWLAQHREALRQTWLD